MQAYAARPATVTWAVAFENMQRGTEEKMIDRTTCEDFTGMNRRCRGAMLSLQDGDGDV